MLKKIVIALAMSLVFVSQANAECVVQETTSFKQRGQIDSISNITKKVTPYNNDKQRCKVFFDARVDGQMHKAMGSYIFTDSEESGCGVAFENAKRSLLEELFPQKVDSRSLLICDERDPDLKLTGLEGLTPHPKHPGFVYQGQKCKYFYDTVQEGSNFYQWTVIMCQTGLKKWSEIDRF